MCDVLEIDYPNGHMEIYLKGSFPKNKVMFIKFIKFTKILSIQERQKVFETLKVYFQNEIDNDEKTFKNIGKVYFHYKDLYAETKHQVENHKYNNGVYILDSDLKEMKINLKLYQNIFQSYEKEGKRYKRKIDNFKYYLKVVKSNVL